MPPSLPNRVQQVQAAAGRLICLHGLARFAIAVVLTVTSLALLDYLLRLHDPLARWLLSTSLLASGVLAFAKLALPPLRVRQTPIGTAQRIESRFPELGGRLSSAIAFLTQAQDDPTAGSRDLRRATIAQAEALASGLDFRAALDHRAPRRAALFAAAALAIAAILATVNPPMAGLALARLAQPWRELAWPRRHELAFVQPPSRLAKGGDLELVLNDRRGVVPSDLQLQIRHETPSGWHIETKQMKLMGEQMIFRLENVTRGFEYRARGGDDDTMPWTELTVVEPPKIIELQIVIEPPAYTRLAPKSEGQIIKALVGSKLRIRGQLDQPIQEAILKSASPDFSLPAAEIIADGRQFQSPPLGSSWIVERSDTFSFELTDRHGMSFGKDTRIELHATHDTLPSIAWEAPADHSFVTTRAALPIKALVKDDLAVHSVQLRYLRPGKSDEEQIVDLYVGQASSLPSKAAPNEGESRRIDYAWDLSRLAGLSPGDVLAIRLTAEDYKPQLATTTVRRVTVISEEELESRIATRQTVILSQLADALRMAQQCREQSQSLEVRLRETGQVLASDLNSLQAAQHNLRQVQRLLAETSEGAAGQIASLLAELAANHAEHRAGGQHLRELLSQVQLLNQHSLPSIDRELTEAFKTAREALPAAGLPAPEGGCADPPATEVIERLRAAGAREDEVVQSLESMVGALSQWDNFSRIAREIGQVRADQVRLAGETDELKVKTVAATADIPPADRVIARQLGQRQLELARRLDKLQTRMEEMLSRLMADDPLAAAALADALDVARRLAIGGRMREATARLTQLQLGQARQSEQEVLDALQQLIESLSTRRDYELARGLASLRQAATDLRGLAERGVKMEADLERLAAQLPENRRNELLRLRRELDNIAQASQQLARRLQRLQAQRVANSLGQAAAASSAGAQAAGTGNVSEAAEQAGQVRRRLEEAQEQLVRAVAAAEQELAQEQLAQVEQTIAGIVSRQKNVIAETQRLEGHRDMNGRLEANHESSLKNVVAEQRLLADETAQLQPRFATAAAFGFALEASAAHMRRAGLLLVRGQTAAPTQDAERAALSRLEQILLALRPDETSHAPASDPPMPDQGPASQQSETNLAAMTAELKLLKLLQQVINNRTTELEALRAKSGPHNPDQQQELDSLAREQGRLADMVLGLIKAAAQRPEDNLEAK